MPSSASTNPFGTGQTPLDPMAAALLKQALTNQPMSSPWQLAGRLAQFGVGTWIDQSERDSQRKEAADFWNNAPGLKSDAAPTVPAAPAIPGVSAPPRPAAAPADASANPTRALLAEAAKTVGVDPNYVVRIAGQESAFDPNAKSDTGALGLGQFMPATWKTYIAKYGPAYGYGPDTPATDPKANALMTAHYTKDSMGAFRSQYGRDPGPGELYAMHFLGQGGAAKVFAANDQDTMDRVMPDIYRSSPTNKAAMSDRSGQPLTVAAFKQRLNQIASGPQLAQAAPGGIAPATQPGVPSAPAIPRAAIPGAAPPSGAVPAGDAPAPPPANPGRIPNAIPPEVVAQIRKGLASRNPQIQAAAKQLYLQYVTPDKPTDDEREYIRAQRDPAFREYLIQMKQAGTNQFSVNMPPAEKAADVESAKLGVTRLGDLGKAADQANEMTPTVMRIGALLDRVQTGKFAPMKVTIGQYAKSLGIDVGALGFKGDELVDAETLRSLMISQVTKIAKTLGANPTNYDAQLLAQQVVNLENTPEGNRQILKTTQDAIKFATRYEKEAAAYFKQHRNLYGFADDFAQREAARRRKAGLPMPGEEAAIPTQTAPADPQKKFAVGPNGERIYHDGQGWRNEDGTPYAPGAR